MLKPAHLALLMLGGIAVAGILPAAARPLDYAARLQLEHAVVALGHPAAEAPLRSRADTVMANLGLPQSGQVWPEADAAPEFLSTTTALVELVDMRLLLTQIAVQTGARDHLVLTRAQGDRDHKVILLRGGLVTLAELFALSRGTAVEDFVRQTAEGVVLTRPLAIWADAGLHLGAADHLVLDRPAGSFLANLGWLDMAGGTLSGTAGPNLSEAAFRPFALTAGAGTLSVRDSAFMALGFGDTAVFGGLSVVNNGLQPPRFAPQITGSTFSDVTTLSLLGTRGATVSGNDLTKSNGTAILVSRSDRAVIAANSVSDQTGPQAIRITTNSADIKVVGNIMTGKARAGILIDRDSRGVVVTGNIILAQLTTGLGISDADCVTVRDNLIAANAGAGVSIRDADGVTVADNAILFNTGAGVLIRDQAAQALARLSGNVLIGNTEGLRGATPGLVSLTKNNLDGQLPRIFAGDFSPMMVDWLRNGETGITAAATVPLSGTPCIDNGAN